jgi:methoxymalonate biosynthesis acyl carrier protein
MTTEQIQEQVRAFVSRFFTGHELGNDEDMFATGYVNSMFAMQLVQFVESAFGVAVENDDLELDNFRSIDAITALVQRKLAQAAAV